MKKIGFCLYNTGLCDYTVDPLISFIDNKYYVFVLHNDAIISGRSIKTNDLYESCDISYMSVGGIIDYIKKNEIEVFVFFTFQSDIDKLIVDVCRFLKIPVILHDHGIVYGTDPAGQKMKTSINYKNILRKFIYIKKFIDLSLVNGMSLYRCMLFLLKYSGKIRSYDYYFIYSNNNKEYYKNFFFLNDQNTSIVGMPYFKDEGEIISLKNNNKTKKILYVHQPFIQLGISEMTYLEESHFICEIGKIAEKYGYYLEVRYHPSYLYKKQSGNCKRSDIVYDNQKKLTEQAAESAYILGHWSTALAIGRIINIPIVIIKYPKVKSYFHQYYNIYNNVSLFCENLVDFEHVLSDKCTVDYSNTYISDKWSDLIGINNTYEYNSKVLKDIVEKIC